MLHSMSQIIFSGFTWITSFVGRPARSAAIGSSPIVLVLVTDVADFWFA